MSFRLSVGYDFGSFKNKRSCCAPVSNSTSGTRWAMNITKDVQVFPTFSWLEGVYIIHLVKLLQNCYGRVIDWQVLPQSSDYC